MELVQEVYNSLTLSGTEWPEYAVIVIRDNDGDIKFSSVGKSDIDMAPTGIFMRGEHCLFNNRIVPSPVIKQGTRGAPEIVTRSEYENFFQAKR